MEGISSSDISFFGQAYPNIVVTILGGVGSYSISVSGLPNGLNFDGLGNISGTPALGSNGTKAITTMIKDSNAQNVQIVSTTLNLTIKSTAIKLGTVSLPAIGSTAVGYTGSVSASAGVGSLTWNTTGLPAGLTINKTTGSHLRLTLSG